MRDFLERYGIELAIEPVQANPMGPEHWQAGFVHYALWVTSAETRQGVPLYFSYDRRCLEPGSPFFAEATHPTLEFTFTHMARVLYSWQQGLDFFRLFNGLMEDADGALFYFMSIQRVTPSLERLLGKEGLDEFLQIGGQQPPWDI